MEDIVIKRVKAAYICQMLHGMLKEKVGQDYAVKQVKVLDKDIIKQLKTQGLDC